jgi:acylglycerol lipase
VRWRAEGKNVALVVDGKRRTGGWAKVMPDAEWFVRRESERAKKTGKGLWLWGFSMVSRRDLQSQ